jgi:hypothetical protein
MDAPDVAASSNRCSSQTHPCASETATAKELITAHALSEDSARATALPVELPIRAA